MIVFWRLLFGHLLADFTFQSNFINRWKRTSFWGMVAHCATHPLCYVALTWPYLNDVWVDALGVSLTGWACVGLLFGAHFVEDYWRVFTIFRYRTPDNTLYFLWDQLIHYAVIFAVIPVALRGPAPSLMPEKWPVVGCLFVLVTHACTVLIYFVEKDMRSRGFPGGEEKYLGMLERLVLALCFLIPGNLWPLLCLGWLAIMWELRVKRVMDLSWFNFYLGGFVAVLCGLAARVIYYA